MWNVTRVPWDQAALAGLDRARGEGRGAVEERKEVLSAGVVVKQFAPVGTVPFHGEIVPSMAWRGRGYVTAPCPRTPESTKKGTIGDLANAYIRTKLYDLGTPEYPESGLVLEYSG